MRRARSHIRRQAGNGYPHRQGALKQSRRSELHAIVRPPTEQPRSPRRAGVIVSYGHSRRGGSADDRRRYPDGFSSQRPGLAVVVGSPAQDSSTRVCGAGMSPSSRDIGEPSRQPHTPGNISILKRAITELTRIVGAPAPPATPRVDRTSVLSTGRDGAIADAGFHRHGTRLALVATADPELAVGIRSPAPGDAIVRQRTSVRISRTDRVEPGVLPGAHDVNGTP